MGDKNVKLIRKQLRNVVQEIIGEVVSKELVANVETRLLERQDIRMNALADTIKTVVEQVDNRSKEVSAYLVRASTPQAPQPEEPILPPTPAA
jgi:hypothetical protein